jgi:hypothetical protein
MMLSRRTRDCDISLSGHTKLTYGLFCGVGGLGDEVLYQLIFEEPNEHIGILGNVSFAAVCLSA